MSRRQEEQRELIERTLISFFGLIFFTIGVFIFVIALLPIIMLPMIGTNTQGIVENLVESEYHEGDSANVGGGVSKYTYIIALNCHVGRL